MRAPRAVAERLRAELERELAAAESIERIEVAGPGFVNLFLSDAWYRRAMAGLGTTGELLGPAPTGSPERILVEFVSANPTGPLHVGGGRHAAYGDALVRLLEAVGHDVRREFYVNDAGNQVERFAHSIAARMTGAEMPEDGYEGAYVAELAERLAAEGVDPTDTEALGRRGVEVGAGGRARHPRALRRPLSTAGSPSATSTSAVRSTPPSLSSTRTATLTAAKTPSGCAPPSSATTRIGY